MAETCLKQVVVAEMVVAEVVIVEVVAVVFLRRRREIGTFRRG